LNDEGAAQAGITACAAPIDFEINFGFRNVCEYSPAPGLPVFCRRHQRFTWRDSP
jgi:hypothetical protein